MLDISLKSVLGRVEETYDKIQELTLSIMNLDNLENEEYPKYEGEIFHLLYDKDITYLNLLLMKAEQVYLEESKEKESYENSKVVPLFADKDELTAEDIYLNVTHYIRYFIVTKEINGELGFADEIYTFDYLNKSLNTFISLNKARNRHKDDYGNDDLCESTYCLTVFLKILRNCQMDQLYFFAKALDDQIKKCEENNDLKIAVIKAFGSEYISNLDQTVKIIKDYRESKTKENTRKPQD